MSQTVTQPEIDQFKADRELLPYRDSEIAKSMGMDRSNFSSYYNGKLPITRAFLRRFYFVHLDEIKKARQWFATFPEDKASVFENSLKELFIITDGLSKKVAEVEQQIGCTIDQIKRLEGRSL